VKHRCTKTYDHVFEADALDANGWVMDFGSLKWVKDFLAATFDHRTVVAADDPDLEWFNEAYKRGIIQLTVVERTGCEAFAKLVFEEVTKGLERSWPERNVRVIEVECREHGANGASVVMA
jgi:6-pyruvoyltetrahydropterin/6-carboxytetrahydropterin synthase